MPRVEAAWRPSPVWLLWLLIILAAAVGLAIFTASRSYQPAPPAEPIASSSEPITNYLTVAEAPDKLALTGRRVVVKDVPVESVAGRLLWAGKPGREVPVVVNAGAPGPLAPHVQIEAGDDVNITGNVRRMPAREEARAMWNLPQEQLDRLAGHPVYIEAESVTVASG